MKDYNSTVIDFTDKPKNAALYFDKVIPLNSNAYKDKKIFQLLPQLIPKELNLASSCCGNEFM